MDMSSMGGMDMSSGGTRGPVAHGEVIGDATLRIKNAKRWRAEPGNEALDIDRQNTEQREATQRVDEFVACHQILGKVASSEAITMEVMMQRRRKNQFGISF